jgi:hypothetical protein
MRPRGSSRRQLELHSTIRRNWSIAIGQDALSRSLGIQVEHGGHEDDLL